MLGVREGLVSATSIEVEVGLIFLDAEGIVFLHVLLVDRGIVLQVLTVGDTQLLEVLTELGLQFLVLLILGEGLIGRALCILAIDDAQDSEHITKGSPEKRTGRGITDKGLPSPGGTAHQHPGIRQLFVLLAQLIRVFQDGKQFAFGLQHIRCHIGIILTRHIVEELIETLRAHLRQLQCIEHPYRLLQVIVPTRLQIRLTADSLIGIYKLVDGLVVVDGKGEQVHLSIRSARKEDARYKKEERRELHWG